MQFEDREATGLGSYKLKRRDTDLGLFSLSDEVENQERAVYSFLEPLDNHALAKLHNKIYTRGHKFYFMLFLCVWDSLRRRRWDLRYDASREFFELRETQRK